jgi:hypothetical protein
MSTRPGGLDSRRTAPSATAEKEDRQPTNNPVASPRAGTDPLDPRAADQPDLAHLERHCHLSASAPDRRIFCAPPLVGSSRSVRDSPTDLPCPHCLSAASCARRTPGAFGGYHQRHRSESQASERLWHSCRCPCWAWLRPRWRPRWSEHRRQLPRGSDCSTTYLQIQIYITR